MKHAPRICYISLVTALITIAGGCASAQNNSNKMDNPKEWETGAGELTDQISNDNGSESFSGSSDVLDGDDDLLNETSYALPSGEWFVHNGEGKIDYDLSSGKMEPGADWEAQLMSGDSSSIEVDRDIRIQLKEIADDFEEESSLLDETIHIDCLSDEKTIMQGRLPSDRDKTYLLSVQIMGTNGLVTDTLVSQIHVPDETVEASLNLDKDKYTDSDDNAHLKVFNEGPTRLTLGKAYRIEKYIADTWRIVPLDLEFEDIGIVVDAYGYYEQRVPLQALGTGQYRVVKQIRAEGVNEDITLAAEFSIQS